LRSLDRIASSIVAVSAYNLPQPNPHNNIDHLVALHLTPIAEKIALF